MRRDVALLVLGSLAGATAAWVGLAFGLWWITFVAGILLGLLASRSRLAALAGVLAGALGWGLPLVWLSRAAPVAPTAEVISGVLGARGSAVPAIALTVVEGALLGLAGAWLAAAARALIVETARAREV